MTCTSCRSWGLGPVTKASFCMLTKPPTFTSLLGVCSTAGCLRPPTRHRSPLGLCQVLSTLPALSLLTAVPLHKKRSHGVVPVPSIAAGISWFLLGVAFQPVAFLSYSIEHPGIDLTGTHGDSGAGLKPPPSAKLSTLPCCLRNVVPRINPYSSPSTTLTGILLTRSSGMNTNGISHDPTMFIGGTPLWIGFAALSKPLPLELIILPLPFAFRSTQPTKDSGTLCFTLLCICLDSTPVGETNSSETIARLCLIPASFWP